MLFVCVVGNQTINYWERVQMREEKVLTIENSLIAKKYIVEEETSYQGVLSYFEK